MVDAEQARDRAEAAARACYGRLLAMLVAENHDVAAAEDALADAFERALRTWPVDGVPQRPEAWLLTVARNRRRDYWRSAAWRTSVPLDPQLDDLAAPPSEAGDRRLELLLVCAHEAIPPAMRTPLMLNTVLGYTAEQIGRAFAVPPTTMASRLVRCKKRIVRDRIPFAVPEDHELPDRLAPVLEAIYGAFSIEWPNLPRARQALILGLGEVVADVAPTSAEAHGLAAFMCLSSARLAGRVDADGRYVPLPEQDPDSWDASLISRGHSHLRDAHRIGEPGRFQLEAAIAAMHCARMPGGEVDWPVLRRLHVSLQRLAPTVGGAVALAAVVAETDGPRAGLDLLDQLDGADRYQPAWSTRASLLERLGRWDEAAAAYERAVSLSTDQAERDHLTRRRDGLAERRCADDSADSRDRVI
ncbi:putative RNA polymerase ECF-type sigma factor [Gordonia araii NBRC 100433]|uniref:Putative RNA polymerase ECF-type sigma factor n=1 Tax=Gordonia araii NBRC 100433 TaxID=1073574 RepID=G7H0Z5_9ACTN|nr:DUF6596 domain-containing protein [Gordonia araii]NNG97313.1 RNA polymerase subunit sigma-70 [Gordonia araii NBRC 100433]GAB09520.1 putative RNA polymerase ECF-type sigma factor [Gordonia araii NBRC 100433]